MISCAFVFAAMIVSGLAARCPNNLLLLSVLDGLLGLISVSSTHKKLMLGDCYGCVKLEVREAQVDVI